MKMDIKDLAVTDIKFSLALATMDAYIGIRFFELQLAQQASEPDVETIARLKSEFAACYARRDTLSGLDDAGLDAVVVEIGPLVRAVVAQQRERHGEALR